MMKPFFVRKLKDRYSCCCIEHVQMLFFKDAFNQMRQSKSGLHLSCNCRCDICLPAPCHAHCVASHAAYSSVSEIWESFLCKKAESSMFHDLSCLLGECATCLSRGARTCPKEISDNNVILSVKLFEDIETGHIDDTGGKKKRKDVVIKHLHSKQFLPMFQQHVRRFVKHNFIARWQALQFKECLTKFPSDVVVSVIDFAENYSFKEQNEIQSMHWYSAQVTILVQITYMRTPTQDILKVIHFYISDDKMHDTLFVQHCMQLHYKWLKENSLTELKRHWVWSDGCAAQFKSKRPFYFIGR